MVFSVLLAGISFVFLYKMLVQTIRKPLLRLLATALLAMIVFSPAQQENWLWGWQIQWYLNTLGLLVAVWALTTWQRSPIVRLFVAVAAAVLATYSLASGLFVWAVCLPILILRKELRRYCWVWISSAAISIGGYYWDYHDPGQHPAPQFFLHHLLLAAHYWLVYIAHPLAGRIILSIPAATLLIGGLIASIVYFWQTRRSELGTVLLPWLVIGLYTCFVGFAMVYSRIGFGVDQAYSSRYITLAQFLTIALCILLFSMLDRLSSHKASLDQRIMRRTLIVGLGIIACAVLLNYAVGVVQMKHERIQRLQAYSCARAATAAADECLTQLYPNKFIVWPRLEYLRGIHWGGL
jgi:hypothetical protein